MGCFRDHAHRFLEVCAPTRDHWKRYGWASLTIDAVVAKVYREDIAPWLRTLSPHVIPEAVLDCLRQLQSLEDFGRTWQPPLPPPAVRLVRLPEAAPSQAPPSPNQNTPPAVPDAVHDAARKKRGRPAKQANSADAGRVERVMLWRFLLNLLEDPRNEPCIHWVHRDQGIFRILNTDWLARLWGRRHGNPRMTYEKMARAMRTYYRSKVLQPVPRSPNLPRKLVYKFNPSVVHRVAAANKLAQQQPPQSQRSRQSKVVLQSQTKTTEGGILRSPPAFKDERQLSVTNQRKDELQERGHQMHSSTSDQHNKGVHEQRNCQEYQRHLEGEHRRQHDKTLTATQQQQANDRLEHHFYDPDALHSLDKETTYSYHRSNNPGIKYQDNHQLQNDRLPLVKNVSHHHKSQDEQLQRRSPHQNQLKESKGDQQLHNFHHIQQLIHQPDNMHQSGKLQQHPESSIHRIDSPNEHQTEQIKDVKQFQQKIYHQNTNFQQVSYHGAKQHQTLTYLNASSHPLNSANDYRRENQEQINYYQQQPYHYQEQELKLTSHHEHLEQRERIPQHVDTKINYIRSPQDLQREELQQETQDQRSNYQAHIQQQSKRKSPNHDIDVLRLNSSKVNEEHSVNRSQQLSHYAAHHQEGSSHQYLSKRSLKYLDNNGHFQCFPDKYHSNQEKQLTNSHQRHTNNDEHIQQFNCEGRLRRYGVDSRFHPFSKEDHHKQSPQYEESQHQKKETHEITKHHSEREEQVKSQRDCLQRMDQQQIYAPNDNKICSPKDFNVARSDHREQTMQAHRELNFLHTIEPKDDNNDHHQHNDNIPNQERKEYPKWQQIQPYPQQEQVQRVEHQHSANDQQESRTPETQDVR